MIVYIASYPRSGNFWLQSLLGNQFQRVTTNIHEGQSKPDILEQWTRSRKRLFNIDVQPLSTDKNVQYGELSDWMVSYKSPEEETAHKGILPGCLGSLNKMEIRDILAKDQEYYFLKTHFLPHNNYLEGEYVVQIVRNPGAVLWSYYNFKRDMRKEYDQDLTSFIHKGKNGTPWEGWSEYHVRWTRASKELKSRYMLIRYEDLFGKELEFCEDLQHFLGLTVQSKELKKFEFYHKIRPALSREGKAKGWEENYSKQQMRLLWSTHQQMMSRFGYPEPNYEMGNDSTLY